MQLHRISILLFVSSPLSPQVMKRLCNPRACGCRPPLRDKLILRQLPHSSLKSHYKQRVERQMRPPPKIPTSLTLLAHPQLYKKITHSNMAHAWHTQSSFDWRCRRTNRPFLRIWNDACHSKCLLCW